MGRDNRSRSVSRSRSRTPRRSRSRSRSRSFKSRSYSRSRSRSLSRNRRKRHAYSKSRSRSYSRSRSRSPRRRRSPHSSRKRHVGNRENPPEGKCLGVFGLSLYTTEREVRDAFDRYGHVDNVQVVYDHATGRSRGFAFVYMRSNDEAADAKESLNGQELDGRRIRVDYSITQRAHTPTPGVYMGKPSTRGYKGSKTSHDDSSSRSNRRSYSRSRSRSPRRW